MPIQPSDPIMQETERKKGQRTTSQQGTTSGSKSKEELAAEEKERNTQVEKLYQEWLNRAKQGEKILPPPPLHEVEKKLGIKANHKSNSKKNEILSQFNSWRDMEGNPAYMMKAWLLLAELIVEQQKAEGKSTNPVSIFLKLVGMKTIGYDGSPNTITEGFVSKLGEIFSGSLSDGFHAMKGGDVKGKLKEIEKANAPARTLEFNGGQIKANGLEGEKNRSNRAMVNDSIEEAFKGKGYQLDDEAYLVKPSAVGGEFERVAWRDLNTKDHKKLSDIVKEPSLDCHSAPSCRR